jgi:cytochrome P450/NADPH-cytochrome P450 reductase
VFSREGNSQRRYVQDAIIERADDVWDLIANKNANIYVCGNANTMAPGVRTALIQVLLMNSDASTDGNNWLAGLRAEGRFLEDIWGG